MEQNERTSMVNDNTNMTISSEAMAITSFFVSSSLFTREQKYLSLIVSLYARRENANKEVLEILSPFVADLEETFSKLDNFFGKRGWKETVSSEYDTIIRYCYKEMMKAAIPFNRHETINIPKELVELCVKSVDCNKVANIFLPYAGNCEFAYYLDRCYCDGFEPSQKTWAIQQIILDAYQMNANIIRSSSSAPTFNKDSKKYDFIFTLPPHIYGAGGIAMIPTFTSMLEHALNDGGAMCMIIPTAITVSRPWKAFRQQLIDKSDIYSLASVSLPKQTISQSTVDMCLLVIQKNGDNNGKVLMVNGNHPDMYILDKVSHRVSLKVDSILEGVEKYDERIARVIPFAELGEDILLTADRYFADEGMRDAKEGEKLTNIADLIEIIPPLPRDTNLTKGGVIGMRELSDNYLTSEIDLSTIREEDTNSTHVFAKATECLAGFIGGRFKVGYFPEECNNKCILLRREIIQFRLRQGSGISRDYLFRELMSDYVQRQAERLSKGAAITRISKEDFLSLRIYVPSKEQQDSLVFSDGLAGMSAEDRERIKAQADFRKDIHMKKHAIGQTIFNLGNWLNNLAYARKAGNGIIDENAEIGGIVKIKVSDIFNNIDAAMKVLTHQIQKFDESYGMKPENIALADFLDDYIATHQHACVLYDYDSWTDRLNDDLPDYDDSDPNPANWKITGWAQKGTPLTFVEFPKEALTIILDNIVSNAVSHGFTDTEKEYTIRLRTEAKGSKVILSISNNGAPLPPGKDPDSVFVYGDTTGDTRSHYGIGGYQVKNFMKEFDGDAEIISTPDEEFTVTYNLIFGKNNIVDLGIE